MTRKQVIPEVYLILKRSKRDLVYNSRKCVWQLPAGPDFPSLRLARTYIKKNVGRLEVDMCVHIPGVIRKIEQGGKLSFAAERSQ